MFNLQEMQADLLICDTRRFGLECGLVRIRNNRGGNGECEDPVCKRLSNLCNLMMRTWRASKLEITPNNPFASKHPVRRTECLRSTSFSSAHSRKPPDNWCKPTSEQVVPELDQE